jgi:hypothetical protein
MALVHADFVEETTATTGTGTLSLAGATTGNRTFVAGIGDGNTCTYAIRDANGTAWEVGIGTVTDAATDTLSRDTLIASSTGSKIDLSTGTHTVYCTFPAEGGDKAYSAIQPGDRGVIEAEPSEYVSLGSATTLTKASHQGKVLYCTAAVSLTVDNSTDFDAMASCEIVAWGGIVTMVATATINRVSGKPLTIPQYGRAVLTRSDTADTYLLTGEMA